MVYRLKRHAIPVTAFLRQSLVLTYAFPGEVLKPLLPPGLVLDTYGDYGFLAIALVETKRLRPAFLPAALGLDCFLSGYRIFTRLGSRAGSLRGLLILRSDTTNRWMAFAGNAFTHYRYRLCSVDLSEGLDRIEWSIRTTRHEADLQVVAHIGNSPAALPAGSPFVSEKDARRFAGPLPYTFDYERETNSIIRVRGIREQWGPTPVNVEVLQNTYLRQEPFCYATPILANAFYLREVPYRWERGRRSFVEPA